MTKEESAPLQLTPRQTEIYQILNDQDPELARMYIGVLYAYTHSDNPDYMSQTAHAVRELLAELPRHFGIEISSGFSIKNELDNLLSTWDVSHRDLPTPDVGEEGRHGPDSVDLPIKLYSKLQDFLDRYRSSRLKHREKVGRLFGRFEAVPTLSVPKPLEPIVRQWIALYDWFVKVAHHGRCDPKELGEKLQLFEDALFALLSPFYGPIEEVEPFLIVEKPTKEEVEQAIVLLKREEHVTYFFSHLKHPGWLDPLRERGYFRYPPPPEKTGGGNRFPSWPEATYLRHVAEQAPKAVVEIIKSLPPTENVTVQHQLLDAALSMPGRFAAELVGIMKEWVLKPSPSRLPEKFGELMGKLARDGRVDGAIELAETLLQPTVETTESVRMEFIEVPLAPNVKAHFDDWYYSQILQVHFPVLLQAAPKRAFELLCYKLRRAIVLRQRTTLGHGGEDASPIWRPAVELHEQNRKTEGIRNALVTALRDSGEWMLKEKPRLAEQSLDTLIEIGFPIFQRLEIHLLRKAPDSFSDRGVERLLSKDLFENPSVRHEYVLLLADKFSTLAKDVQEEILSRIGRGPDRKSYIEQIEALRGEEPPEEEVTAFVERWQLRWLAPLRDLLPSDWRERYEKLERTHGEPEHPEFTMYSESFMGPTSPVSEEDLRTMGPARIPKLLRKWEPSDEDFGPSREGLGTVLSSVVTEDPDRYLALWEEFKTDIHPAYVRAFLSGFREACKAGGKFDWGPVLELSRWVVEQPKSDWVHTRRAVAGLISQGLLRQESSMPFELREEVWPILKTLLNDPEPTQSYEASFGAGSMDPVTVAINTVRGLAMEGVIRYALWCSPHINASGQGKKNRKDTLLSKLPEVKEMLEGRLDPEVEPSPAVHSIYGRYLPNLVYLDEHWVTENLHGIFPRDSSLEILRVAAAQAYLEYSRPYSQLASMLEDEYTWIVEWLQKTPSTEEYSGLGRRLAEHLMTLYWHGSLSLDEKSPVSEFFDKLAPFLRAYAISFIGTSLQKVPPDKVTHETRKRLRDLWEMRVERAKSGDSEELEAFGFWAASEVFDASWMLGQLKKTLERTGGSIGVGYQVLAKVALMAGEYPNEAVELLNLMVRFDTTGMAIYRWKEDARSLLQTVIDGNDEEAIRVARAVINYLGSIGFHEFRDLLNT